MCEGRKGPIRGKRINFLRKMCASPRPVALFVARNSMQIINQSFRVSKISRAEPLGEPVVNWFDDGNRFSATALIAQQAGEARRTSPAPVKGALPRPPVDPF